GGRAGDRCASEEVAPVQIGRFGSNFRRRNRNRFPDQHSSPRLLFTRLKYARQTDMDVPGAENRTLQYRTQRRTKSCNRWQRPNCHKALTTKDTKEHEGNHRGLRVTSCPYVVDEFGTLPNRWRLSVRG